MPNPLTKFDNQRRPAYVTSDGQQLFVRLLTSPESVLENAEKVKLLAPIAWETLTRLIENIKKYPQIREAEISDSDIAKIDETWFKPKIRNCAGIDWSDWAHKEFPTEFGGPNNYTAMILEDEHGNPLSVMSFTIDDEAAKSCVKTSKESAPTIFFELSQTKPEREGEGFLKIMRSYLLPSFLEEAGFLGKVYMANAMKRFVAHSPEGKLIYDGIANFPPHGTIFQLIDPAAKMLERWRNKESQDSSRDGDSAFPVSDFFTGKEFNKEKLRDWIKTAIKMQPDQFLAGCFMRAEVENIQELTKRVAERLFTKAADGSLIAKPKEPIPKVAAASSAAVAQGAQERSVVV